MLVLDVWAERKRDPYDRPYPSRRFAASVSYRYDSDFRWSRFGTVKVKSEKSSKVYVTNPTYGDYRLCIDVLSLCRTVRYDW